MSCALYLTCHSHRHTSPITSDGEVGNRLSDLPQVREWIRERDFLTRCVSDFADAIDISGCMGNAARFFHEHPDCWNLCIRDENGRDYPECDPDQWYELADEKELEKLRPRGVGLAALETWEEYRLCARFVGLPDSTWRPCASPKAAS